MKIRRTPPHEATAQRRLRRQTRQVNGKSTAIVQRLETPIS